MSLVSKDVGSQSVLIFLTQAIFFGITMLIRPYDNKRDNIYLVIGALLNFLISMCMMILSIDEHKYNFLTHAVRLRYIDRFTLFFLFVIKQFGTMIAFGVRAGGYWRKLSFLFAKAEEQDWQKKKREVDEREARAAKAKEDEELAELEKQIKDQERARNDPKFRKELKKRQSQAIRKKTAFGDGNPLVLGGGGNRKAVIEGKALKTGVQGLGGRQSVAAKKPMNTRKGDRMPTE